MFDKKISGAKLIYNRFIKHNVKDVFIYSGGAIMPLIDCFHEQFNNNDFNDFTNTKNNIIDYNYKINYFINTHEQSGGHSATAYAKSSGKPGISIVTSGPGLTNSVTPITDALYDSTPLIVFSGQVPLKAMGTNAFQECPSTEITKSITKWNYCVKDIYELDDVIDEAFNVCMNGKKGPVHIDLPKCVIAKNINLNDYYNYNNNLKEKFSYNFYYFFNNNINHIYNKDNHDNNKDKNVIYLDDGNSNYDKFYTKYNNILIKEKNIDNSKIKNISKLINKSEKPVIIVGKGCNNYHNELRKFAISANIPVTTTIHAMGCFDETHNLSLDFLGMHGNVSANYAVQNADLIINLGSRFEDRITGNSEGFAPKAFEASKNNNGGIIHVNIEPSEINKVIDSHFNFNNDCGTFLNAINDNFIEFKKRTNWFKQINYWKEKYPFKFELNKNYLKTQEIISELNNYLLDNNIDNYFITTGVGNHQMMASQFIKWKYPNTFISSGSLGVMGAGLPYSIG